MGHEPLGVGCNLQADRGLTMTRKQLAEHFRIMAWAAQGDRRGSVNIAKGLFDESISLDKLMELLKERIDKSHKSLKEEGKADRHAEITGELNTYKLAETMIKEIEDGNPNRTSNPSDSIPSGPGVDGDR